MSAGDEPLQPRTCGHSASTLSTGFVCLLLGDHDEHVWRGEATASRGLGYNDNLSTELEVRWRDDRPAATVGDVRRALTRSNDPVGPEENHDH